MADQDDESPKVAFPQTAPVGSLQRTIGTRQNVRLQEGDIITRTHTQTTRLRHRCEPSVVTPRAHLSQTIAIGLVLIRSSSKPQSRIPMAKEIMSMANLAQVRTVF